MGPQGSGLCSFSRLTFHGTGGPYLYCSPMDGHVGGCHSVATESGAAVNGRAPVSGGPVSSFLSFCPLHLGISRGITGSHGAQLCASEAPRTNCFPQHGAVRHSASQPGPRFLTDPPTRVSPIGLVWFGHHPRGGEVAPLRAEIYISFAALMFEPIGCASWPWGVFCGNVCLSPSPSFSSWTVSFCSWAMRILCIFRIPSPYLL